MTAQPTEAATPGSVKGWGLAPARSWNTLDPAAVQAGAADVRASAEKDRNRSGNRVVRPGENLVYDCIKPLGKPGGEARRSSGLDWERRFGGHLRVVEEWSSGS
jgi:hypothetical protein